MAVDRWTFRPLSLPLAAACVVVAGLAACISVAQAEDVSRLIVKFRASSVKAALAPAARVERLADTSGYALRHVRPMAEDAQVVELGHVVPAETAARIAAALARDPDVEFAEPDRRRHPLLAANDEFRRAQGYLDDTPGGISAVLAWDITTGSPSTVVAVLDTGIRPHADLAGRLLPGYDMIAVLEVANDGDGRDPDPSDPGDWLLQSEITGNFSDCTAGNSSWHGTSVAGVIGSDSNNGVWTTGIDWAAKILPVRVLGKCGGYDSDIVDGIAWAAGLAVPGVPPNPTPAHVINMSLGGDSSCAASYQNVVAAAYAHGVTRAIVAAAGNETEDVAGHSPANCPGIYAIASTTTQGMLARYSNFGSLIMLSAPGGQFKLSLGNEGIIAISNAGLTVPGTDSFRNLGGTSFAAPMVSGTVALMLAVAPTLTSDQVRSILTTTAKPFPATSDCTTARCGAGILDANAAVRAAAGIVSTAPESVAVVEFYNAALDHYFITWAAAEIANLDAGNTPTRWTRTGYGFRAGIVAQPSTSPVCRFYIPPEKGDSHFFGRGTTECNATAAKNPTFVLEDPAFMQMMLPTAGNCPSGTVPIYRVFSNRPDANHRYMTDRTVRDQMVAKGWVAEGDGPDLVVMCAPS